jgi:hypothetical protein
MLKSVFAAFLAMGPALLPIAGAAERSYEACTFEEQCVIRTQNLDTGAMVWLVKQGSEDLRYIWEGEGEWYVVDDATYSMLASELAAGDRFTVNGVNPDTSETIMERKTTPRPPASSGGEPKAPGGMITVTDSFKVSVAGAECTSCHKGSLHQIHSRILPKTQSQ